MLEEWLEYEYRTLEGEGMMEDKCPKCGAEYAGQDDDSWHYFACDSTTTAVYFQESPLCQSLQLSQVNELIAELEKENARLVETVMARGHSLDLMSGAWGEMEAQKDARIVELESIKDKALELLSKCRTDIIETARVNQGNIDGGDPVFPGDSPCKEWIGNHFVHQCGVDESLQLCNKVDGFLRNTAIAASKKKE